MKHFIKKISMALIFVLLLQISLFGQTSMVKQVEAGPSGPVIISKSPADGFTSASINSTLSITFDELIKKGTGSETINIYENSKNTLFESFPVTSPNVVINGDGRTVNVRPSKSFENNTDYYVLIDPGYFANASNGANFSGIIDPIVWNFKTIESSLLCTLVINNGAAYTNSTSVKLNVLVSSPNNDPLEMTFWEQPKPWSPLEPLSSTKDWTLSNSDGSKTVYMNVSSTSRTTSCGGSIILDTTPPVVTGVMDGKAYNNDVTITFNEGTATLNGASFTSGVTLASEGAYTLLVTDTASNSTKVNFVIDKTAPQGSISILNGATTTNTASVTLNLTGTDTNPFKMQFSNDGSNWSPEEPFTSTKAWTLESSLGIKTVYYKLTDSAGNTSAQYTDTIELRGSLNTNADLKNIAFSKGTITPAFAPNILSYTMNVASQVDSIDVQPMAEFNKATMKVNGNDVVSGNNEAIPLSYGATTITIEVTAEDGITKKVYTVTVNRANPDPLDSNADLKNISFSKGTLTPAFAPNVFAYTMNVASQVSSIDVQPTTDFKKATTKVNGISGNKTVPLNYGANTITIEVTAEDGVTKKTYTVTVNRAKPSNPGTSSPEPVNPVPVQPENPTPVKAIPNTVLPNPHGLPVATLTVNEDIKLYRLDDAGNLVEAKLAEKGSSLFVYDIYQGFYKLADNLYAIPSPSISIYIGKGEVRKEEVNVYDKDGRFLRTIKKGQEYKVYSYDDNRYAIGGGEFIEVQDGVTYVFGWITLTESMILYKADGTVERVLKAGEKYRIYSAQKDVLHLGGGFTVQRENPMYTFVKN